ncbi:hypothetical protein B0J17DRAFT_686751 [Rhizoctonia solani]|nr:hypothetical protein B0J17DRAFT_686751 [Rhizoctonia solani]
MLLKPLGLRVYITDTAGNPLPEYHEKQTKEDSIECWIPSSEGTNFQIHWEILNRTPTTAECDTCAVPYFDGVKLKGKIATSGKNRGKLYGHPVGSDSIRLYQFGKRKFTDEEDIDFSNTTPVEDLGTIRLVIGWGQKVPKKHTSHSFKDPDPASGTVNEKLAKKGFWDVAGLSPATGSRRQTFYNFVKKDATSGNFLFRYASEDVLKAQGIIPTVPKSESSIVLDSSVKLELPNTSLGRKRTHDTASGFNDAETLGGDDRKIATARTKRQKLESKITPQK